MPNLYPEYRSRSVQEIVLQDLKAMQNTDGGIITDVVDVLKEKNELLQDMTFREANRGNDRYWMNITTSYPKAWWMRYNRGIPASKATYASIEETCGTLGARSEIDARMADEQDNSRAFRYMQDRSFVQSLNRDMTHYLFYGEKNITPEGFDGFASRYSTLNTNEVSSKNVIDCGGKGPNLTSIWCICWGDGVFGFHPKHVPLGIRRRDCGRVWMLDDQGNPMDKYVTEFTWSLGLMIPDWRCVVRLCNIDVNDLHNGVGIGDPNIKTANNQNLLLRMQQAIGLIEGVRTSNSRVAFYMNATTKNGLNILSARTNSNVVRVQPSLKDYGDHTGWDSFGGIPLRCVDALKDHEDQVTA